MGSQGLVGIENLVAVPAAIAKRSTVMLALNVIHDISLQLGDFPTYEALPFFHSLINY